MNTMSYLEKFTAWLGASLLVIGAWLVLTSSAQGAEGALPYPSEKFLDALERIESGMDAGAVGDQGRARGPYQMWAVAWKDCSGVRQARGQSVAQWHLGATNRAIARSYARTYLALLHSKFTATLGRAPTSPELYAAWNLGFRGFQRRGFSLARCPAVTQRAGARIAGLVAG